MTFDCDGTLEISNGPVSLDTLKKLQKKGWRVGICGNWQLAKKYRDGLDFYVGSPKTQSLKQEGSDFELKIYVADTLDDEQAAKEANWQFIYAQDFEAVKVLKRSTTQSLKRYILISILAVKTQCVRGFLPGVS